MAKFQPFSGGKNITGHGNIEPSKTEFQLGEKSDASLVPVLDPYQPIFVPSEKVVFYKSWKAKVTSDRDVFDLNELGIMEKFLSTFPGRGNLSHPEIHVMWVSHVPVDNMRHITLNVNCEFTQTTDPDLRLLGSTIFPVGLHSHSICRPGHSISLGKGAVIPWAITLVLSEAAMNPGYIYGELHICLKAYKTPIGQLSVDRGMELISMVPMEEQFNGLSFTRPRHVNKEWIMKSYKLGSRNKGDVDKIFHLQSAGVDVEALVTTKKLKGVLKVISAAEISDPGTPEFKGALLKINKVITSG